MTTASAIRLVVLGAIWGSSFLLQRVAVRAFSPLGVITLRVAFAALFLVVVGVVSRRSWRWLAHWRHLVFVGLVNTAVPFFLFAYAARTLPAALLAVFNSTAPLFGAITARLWLGSKLERSTLFGLICGLVGVAILVARNLADGEFRGDHSDVILALAAGIVAPLCYGIASTYIKRMPSEIAAFDNALGSQLAAALAVAPIYVASDPPSVTDPDAWAAIAMVGLLCTGVAYLLAFRLIADVGPVRALTVTFLVPVFAVIFGALFGDPIQPSLFIGGPLILIGLGFSTGAFERLASRS